MMGTKGKRYLESNICDLRTHEKFYLIESSEWKQICKPSEAALLIEMIKL